LIAQRKSKLWSAAGRKLLEELPLAGRTARRRQDSLQLLDDLDRRIADLDIAAQQEAEKNPVAQLLQTHPGVGPIIGRAVAVTLGQIERFACSRKVVSYLGLNPTEHSSGGRQTAYHGIALLADPAEVLQSQLERNGAPQKPEVRAASFTLDAAVVVIDESRSTVTVCARTDFHRRGPEAFVVTDSRDIGQTGICSSKNYDCQ
jgi:hypothetical protein